MADTLTFTNTDQVLLTFTRDVGGVKIPDRVTSGSGSLPSFKKTLTDGATEEIGLAGLYYRALACSFPHAFTDFDLSALPGQFAGQIVNFAVLKYFRLRIQTPEAGQLLLVGNYGLNGFVGWLDGITATEEVRDDTEHWSRIDGWPVGPTNKILRVQNPGALSIVADLLLVGR